MWEFPLFNPVLKLTHPLKNDLLTTIRTHVIIGFHGLTYPLAEPPDVRAPGPLSTQSHLGGYASCVDQTTILQHR